MEMVWIAHSLPQESGNLGELRSALV